MSSECEQQSVGEQVASIPIIEPITSIVVNDVAELSLQLISDDKQEPASEIQQTDTTTLPEEESQTSEIIPENITQMRQNRDQSRRNTKQHNFNMVTKPTVLESSARISHSGYLVPFTTVTDSDHRSVYLRNVPFHSTKDDLLKHFKDCGEIVRVTIPLEGPNHLPKVCYPFLPHLSYYNHYIIIIIQLWQWSY